MSLLMDLKGSQKNLKLFMPLFGKQFTSGGDPNNGQYIEAYLSSLQKKKNTMTGQFNPVMIELSSQQN